MANFVKTPNFSDTCLYEDGNLGRITIEELVGNDVAIKQLINDRNIKAKNVDTLQKEINKINSELGFQRTSPFFAYVSAAINIIGSILMCVGGGIIQSSNNGWWLIIIGASLTLIGNFQTISHKWVFKWFNKETNNEQSYI